MCDLGKVRQLLQVQRHRLTDVVEMLTTSDVVSISTTSVRGILQRISAISICMYVGVVIRDVVRCAAASASLTE